MMAGLSRKRMAEYREAFDLLDQNGDGLISPTDMENVICSIGLEPATHLPVLMRDVDKDGTGQICFDQFVSLVTKAKKAARRSSKATPEQLLQAFKVFDVRDNGYLTAKDLHHVMTKLGDTLTEEEAEEMISESDVKEQGKMTFEEFVRMLTDS